MAICLPKHYKKQLRRPTFLSHVSWKRQQQQHNKIGQMTPNAIPTFLITWFLFSSLKHCWYFAFSVQISSSQITEKQSRLSELLMQFQLLLQESLMDAQPGLKLFTQLDEESPHLAQYGSFVSIVNRVPQNDRAPQFSCPFLHTFTWSAKRIWCNKSYNVFPIFSFPCLIM